MLLVTKSEAPISLTPSVGGRECCAEVDIVDGGESSAGPVVERGQLCVGEDSCEPPSLSLVWRVLTSREPEVVKRGQEEQ